MTLNLKFALFNGIPICRDTLRLSIVYSTNGAILKPNAHFTVINVVPK